MTVNVYSQKCPVPSRNFVREHCCDWTQICSCKWNEMRRTTMFLGEHKITLLVKAFSFSLYDSFNVGWFSAVDIKMQRCSECVLTVVKQLHRSSLYCSSGTCSPFQLNHYIKCMIIASHSCCTSTGMILMGSLKQTFIWV